MYVCMYVRAYSHLRKLLLEARLNERPERGPIASQGVPLGQELPLFMHGCG